MFENKLDMSDIVGGQAALDLLAIRFDLSADDVLFNIINWALNPVIYGTEPIVHDEHCSLEQYLSGRSKENKEAMGGGPN